MDRVEFSQIFSSDFLGKVTKYSERIQSILNDYDIVIFMARKAVCFYKAMRINREVEQNKKCVVTSSRVIGYNILCKWSGKRIAVVDDVVVKGDSISRIARKLNEFKISADYYVLACQEEFAKTPLFQLEPTFAYYNESEVYGLAGLITQYIEASMCPFNIDQPIYNISQHSHFVREHVEDFEAFDITSSLQRKHNITSFVLYYDFPENSDSNSLQSLFNKSILKIRFLFNEGKTIAIPFVLFPEISATEVENIFDLIKTARLSYFVESKNKRTEIENKLKIVSYFFSEQLFNFFCKHNALPMKSKLDSNDCIQFYSKTDNLFEGVRDKNVEYLMSELKKYSIINIKYSKFNFTQIIASFYENVLNIDCNEQEYEDAFCCKISQRDEEKTDEDKRSGFKRLNNLVFPIESIIKNIPVCEERQKKYFASTLIDIFIDRGYIVPSLVHRGDLIVRAYKMGEYSKLGQKELNIFADILHRKTNFRFETPPFRAEVKPYPSLKAGVSAKPFGRGCKPLPKTQSERHECLSLTFALYEERIHRYLDKTEFEKLCVLTFLFTIKHYFKEQSNPEDDCYAISYSLFGPRVSKGTIGYKVDSDSALLTCFKRNGILEEKTLEEKKKYHFPHELISSNDVKLKKFCKFLALSFAGISTTFSKNSYSDDNVNSLNQYLTLAAIGESKKNQFLSLCAELYQLTQLEESLVFYQNQPNKNKYNCILAGIESGLWKFICYSKGALESIEEKIEDHNTAFLALMHTGAVDRNPALEEMLDAVVNRC